MQDSFDENEFLDENNELLDIENYSLPEKKEVVLDLGQNKLSDVKDLSPIERIVVTARENKIELIDMDISKGYVDTGCRKPGCWGRGYISWDGIIPNPCSCIFKEKNENTNLAPNRTKTRRWVDAVRKEVAFIKDKQAKAMNLRNVGNGFWKSKNGIDFIWSKQNDKWGFRKFSKAEGDLVE